MKRQIIYPRRNQKFATPRVQFITPRSPSPNHLDLSSSTIQSTDAPPPPPPNTITSIFITKCSKHPIPSDYLGSTPTSEKIYENPFNHLTSTQHLSPPTMDPISVSHFPTSPTSLTQAFTQGESILISDPIDISSDTSLSLP